MTSHQEQLLTKLQELKQLPHSLLHIPEVWEYYSRRRGELEGQIKQLGEAV